MTKKKTQQLSFDSQLCTATNRGGWKPGSLTTHRIDPQKPGLPHKLPCRSVQVVESRSWIFKHVLTLWQLMLRLVNSKILTSDPNNSYGTKTIRAPRKKKKHAKMRTPTHQLEAPTVLQKILLYRCSRASTRKRRLPGTEQIGDSKWHAWGSHPQASIRSLSNAFFLKSTFDKPIKPPETMDRPVRTDLSSHLSKKISAHDCCGEFFRLNHGKPPFGGHHGHPFLSWLSAGGGQLVNWHLAQHFWDNCYGSKWYGPHWWGLKKPVPSHPKATKFLPFVKLHEKWHLISPNCLEKNKLQTSYHCPLNSQLSHRNTTTNTLQGSIFSVFRVDPVGGNFILPFLIHRKGSGPVSLCHHLKQRNWRWSAPHVPGSNGWMERPGPCVRVFWGNLTCGIWASFFNHLYSFLHCHIIFHHLTSSYVMVHHLTSCSILPCNHPTIISSCSMLHLPLSKSSFCFCQPPTLPNHPLQAL